MRDINEPFLLKQSEDPVVQKLVAYETQEWGSSGSYSLGGVEALVSTLSVVRAAVGAGFNSSAPGWTAQVESVSSNAVMVTAWAASGSEVTNAKATSGIQTLSFLALGE